MNDHAESRSTDPQSLSPLFVGMQRDKDPELLHMPCRCPDPNPGRWLELDPSGFDAGDNNLYRFPTPEGGEGKPT